MRKPSTLRAYEKRLDGKYVIYRLSKHSPPLLGRLSHRNFKTQWEQGCWAVRADHDSRLYAIEPTKGGSFRIASKEDIGRVQDRKRARADNVAVEQVAGLEHRTYARPLENRQAPEPGKEAAGIGEVLSEEITQEVTKELGNA